jgi:inositol oxygenase
MLGTYKKNYKLQTINHVRFAKNRYENFRLKKYDLWKSFEMLNSKDFSEPLFDRSCKNAHNLKKFINEKNQILDINTSDLFSKIEWSTLATKNKILYGTTFKHLYSHIKNWDWLPLVGLIVNIGKLLALEEFGKADLSLILCEIFPLGCEISRECMFYEECKQIIKKNYDSRNSSKYHSRYGKYKQFCGFENLNMSYSHISFIINQLAKYRNNRIPQEGMYLLRFCLFTAWHSPKESIHRGYPYLANNYDWKMLPLLKLFYRCCFDSNDEFINKLSNYQLDEGLDNKKMMVKDIKKEFLSVKRKFMSRWVF